MSASPITRGDEGKYRRAPVAILILGVGGVGKSSAARAIDDRMRAGGADVRLIRFDEFRKQLAPAGADPFSRDPEVKQVIYARATLEFSKELAAGRSLVIDSGLSKESIRVELKRNIAALRIVHLHCPLLVAVWRDTWRSCRGDRHERGRFLHLRAIFSLLNPFKGEKFPQPGITYAFEHPWCADIHVGTLFKSPHRVAEVVLQALLPAIEDAP